MNTKDDTNEHELEAAVGAIRDAATTTITIGEPQPSTAWPSEAWFAELTKQATPAVLAGAARHARAQLGGAAPASAPSGRARVPARGAQDRRPVSRPELGSAPLSYR